MQVLYTFLYIILFIFCLSILVLVHELGHFTVAKFFKVYIKEFSIGFGPSLIHKKRKNGETYFSLRAFPFGGYVSMYGEGETPDPSLNIAPERAYDKLKRWKKIIILFAGVFNNAVLAIILFLFSNSCFMQKEMYLSFIDCKEDSIAYNEGARTGDYICNRQVLVQNEQGQEVASSGNYYIDDNALITYEDNSTQSVYAVLTTSSATYNSRSYDDILHFFERKSNGYPNLGKEYKASDMSIKSVSYTFNTALRDYKQFINNSWTTLPREVILNPHVNQAYYDATEKVIKKWDGYNWVNSTYDVSGYKSPLEPSEYFIWCDLEAVKTPYTLNLPVETKDGTRVFHESGLGFYYIEYMNEPGTAIKKTFTDFADSATLIGRSFASLFTSPERWKDVGGIVAIGVQTTNILQNFGLAKFIYIWGLISVNLAIVNLFPFPGLDGWQILVLAVEGIFHKEIPEKVKGIVSFIGVAFLLAFMVLILIKDVIGLF